MNKMIALLITMTFLFMPVAGAQTLTDDEIFPGNTVNVVALGGSITAGAGSSQPAKSWFGEYSQPGIVSQFIKSQFPTKNVNFYNAGIGGTGSSYGLFRLGTDVIARNPDYVVVEFAVNDADCRGNVAAELRVKQYMEGIVRQLLRLPKKPYILFLYTTTLDKRACTSVHDEVANAYGIPTINLQDYIHNVYAPANPQFNDNKAFWSDDVHPTDFGYSVYSDYIKSQIQDKDKYFKKAVWHDAPVFGREFSNTKIITASSVSKLTGTWTQMSPPNSSDQYYQTNTVGSKLEFWFTGTALGVIQLMDKWGAEVSLEVDGNFIDTLNPWLDYLTNPMKNTYFCTTQFSPGWHKAVLTFVTQRNSTANGTTVQAKDKIARIGFFAVDMEVVEPPQLTGIGVGTKVIQPSSGFAYVPVGTKAFDLIFNEPLDLPTIPPDSISVSVGGTPVTFASAYNVSTKRLTLTLANAIPTETPCVITLDKSVSSQNISMASSLVLTLESTNRPAIISTAFTNYKGDAVTSLANLNYVGVDVGAQNNTADAQEMTVVIALYDQYGKLQRCSKAVNSAAKPGTVKHYITGFPLPKDKTGLQLKVFVWDSGKNIISRVVVLQ